MEQDVLRDTWRAWRGTIYATNPRPAGDQLMKALVIGIDSASPFLIQKWIDKLQNIRSVFEDGVHGVLKAIVPPVSVPSWQCFATRKNPAKIGNFGLTYI